ncbi:hypothetical protein [Streptomyces aidingensis]|uniref:Uncharacterized protein n=1 Tax=Streptomyces aidingensis TaxID=910347 RepID=A0A1I1NFG7_9ACTN|nr:hypothetical protein [Streptomyces aidingensis]SFC92470.1 hypothetical protein SAMN05421773_107217 [Streptomyces aidingensis]
MTTVSGQARYTCFSLLGDISSAEGTVTVSGEVSCQLSVDLFTPATIIYRWNTGRTPTVTYRSHTVVQAVDGTSIVRTQPAYTTTSWAW